MASPEKLNEVPLVMPKMSMTMTEGIFVAWHKQPGDAVRNGDVVAEVTTDKVDMEVESPIDGVLARLVAEPEDVIPVGDPIAYITSESDDLLGDLFAPPPDSEAPTVPERSRQESHIPAADRQQSGFAATTTSDRNGSGPPSGEPDPVPDERVPAVPAARRRARELGIALATVRPTGPGDVVRLLDVERVDGVVPAPRPAPVPSPAAARPAATDGRPDPTERRRAALARTMTQSAAVPQFVAFRDLDLEVLAAARGRVSGTARPSWTALLVAAHATALRGDPALHATWDGERREPLDHLRVSVAVDTPHGLLAPTLSDPDRLPSAELDGAIAALATRAREGRLTVADLRPGATTVSNLGGLGVQSFTVLLTPPQATALSIGAVGPVPVAVPGGIGTRVRCRVGLAVDHRVADGADAARLLQRLQDCCDDPAALGLPCAGPG